MSSISEFKMPQTPRNMKVGVDEYDRDVEERAYISRKMSKVRWVPECDDSNSLFLTGSYDSPQSNGVDLWSFNGGPKFNDNDAFVKKFLSPKCMDGFKTGGDVTGVNFINSEVFCYCTGDGEVGGVRVNKEEQKMFKERCWNSDDWFGEVRVSCSCLEGYDGQVAVGSLDGRICLFSLDSAKALGTLCNTVPVHCLSWVSSSELATASGLGTVSIWDLRSQSPSPVSSFPFSRAKREAISSMVNFPTEKHMLVCGARNGRLSVFDLRNLPIPIQVYEPGQSPIIDLQFHPNRFSILFSCTSEGEIFQWTNFFELFSPIRDFHSANKTGQETFIDRGLLMETNKVKPNVKTVLKNKVFLTNSIDVNKDKLICGTDNECVIVIKSLYLV